MSVIGYFIRQFFNVDQYLVISIVIFRKLVILCYRWSKYVQIRFGGFWVYFVFVFCFVFVFKFCVEYRNCVDLCLF